MLEAPQSQGGGLVQRYVIHQISALSHPRAADEEPQGSDLHAKAISEVADWAPETVRKKSRFLAHQSFLAALGIRQLYSCLSRDHRPEWVECLLTNSRLLHSVMVECSSALRDPRVLPRVSVESSTPVPRCYLAMRSYLTAVERAFHQQTLVTFVKAMQERITFDIDELWLFRPLLQLRLLQRLLQIGSRLDGISSGRTPADRTLSINLERELATIVASLRELNTANWDHIFDELSVTEQILRKDPIYNEMEPQSRDSYRRAVVEMASHSNHTEAEIAQAAMDLRNQQPQSEDARHRRHVGYFLVDGGVETLRSQVGYRPPWGIWLGERIRNHAASSYLLSIEIVTLAAVAALVFALGRSLPLPVSIGLLLIPAVGAAVEIVNQFVAMIFPPALLPKLDLSKGIPSECRTVVAIPALLLSETQTRQMVDALEVRFLGNRDKNLHYALLTDSVDSTAGPSDNDPLIRLCSQLIDRLNRKYAQQDKGTFFHFHRPQIYCPAEGVWMGWERKRGKLLDFNSYLRGERDPFLIKTGDLNLLNNVKYVITLDSDTQLPRDVARRLIGTLAHPLNRAVFDETGMRLQRGYTILQPKAGVAIESARKSRLAAIFSTDATFDVYTRAISDVYQDLFGEGNFIGKGIYDVDAFHRLLDSRVPEGTLLSHDMIEGSFARAGLVTDIEIIEDYPSRYSAYCRRKHRWARGDWQTAPWMFPRVADRFGRDLPNALHIISRWKIVDNLRRAIYEPFILILLLAGWLFLPGGPVFWTGATLVLAVLPTFLRLVAGLLKPRQYSIPYLKNLALSFALDQVRLAMFFATLLHQSALMIDAAVRTLYRMLVSRKKLLEWETAAQAEMNSGPRSLIDKYLDWIPWLSFVLTGVICLARPSALPVALPFLISWFLTAQLAKWLDGWWIRSDTRIASRDREFLRDTALRTWRFFEEFSCVRNHWLIPDRVQEKPTILVDRVSPTNLGLLLNTRFAAHDLGFVALPEVVRLTRATLDSIEKLARFKGQFYNWYNTQTLQAEPPFFISSVDSGNFACSLLTTSQGLQQSANEPVFGTQLWQGIRDRVRLLAHLVEAEKARPEIVETIALIEDRISGLRDDGERWISELPALQADVRTLEKIVTRPGLATEDFIYWSRSLSRQMRELNELASTFAPWLLPAHKDAIRRAGFETQVELKRLSLEDSAKMLESLTANLQVRLGEAPAGPYRRQLDVLFRKWSARLATIRAIRMELDRLAERCENLAEEMDFTFLYNRRRKLLSIGYNGSAERLESACYDLIASEARIAAFVAIAKGDIPQESWFALGRGQTHWENAAVLISWGGSLFEYLMPNLWMRTFPNTLLDATVRSAVSFHQQMEILNGHPWGMSEAAFSDRDPNGLFQYDGFGAPGLALKRYSIKKWIVSSYSTFLALNVDTHAALRNLRLMQERAWSGTYGFYESAEIFPNSGPEADKVTRCWMAHHQGMILLAISNSLSRSMMHKRFHAVPMVAATERLLHEKVPSEMTVAEDFALPALDLELGPAVNLAADSIAS